MNIRLICRRAVRAIGIFGAISPFIGNWNTTHVFNTAWPPHARFHNAQTMTLGVLLGILTFYLIWRKEGDQKFQFLVAAVCASFYWISQGIAIFFPGTSFYTLGVSSTMAGQGIGLPVEQMQAAAAMLVLVAAVFFYLREETLLQTSHGEVV